MGKIELELVKRAKNKVHDLLSKVMREKELSQEAKLRVYNTIVISSMLSAIIKQAQSCNINAMEMRYKRRQSGLG